MESMKNGSIENIFPKNELKKGGEPLGFSDSKHFCAAGRTCSSSSWFSIFHCNGFCVLHLPFTSAFYTISCCHDSNTELR